MTRVHEIWRLCRRCDGTGDIIVKQPDPENPVESEYIECPCCLGVGKQLWGSLHEDLMDLFNNMNDKLNDIIEKLNE